MSSVYKQQLNLWKSTLDVSANVLLDIGGSQDPLKGKTKSWNVDNYYIVDLDSPHVETVKPDLVQDMNQPLKIDIKADSIYMLGVMDYVINPNIALDNISSLLTDDGIAWIEWPFNYATHNPVDDEGCRYSEGCIKRLCKQSGLEITEWVRKMDTSGLLVRFYQEQGQRMAKEYNYHGVTGFITRVQK